MKRKQSGQSLVEVLIALVVVTLLSSSLIIAIITGLKNSQFAQKQTQATKFGQDAMDRIRTIRDRDGIVNFATPSGTTDIFSELWEINMSGQPSCTVFGNKCYLKLVDTGGEISLIDATSSYWESVTEGLSRQIFFEDKSSGTPPLYQSEKDITVKVKWTDTSGDHESYLQTTLTKY